ncbi:Uncharacterized protein ChrSV_3148 [Chromobacterium vaccinii]|nr:Uncharacterized protein ChrSW_3148 [Chromobacterium vaccinii]QND90605.1 Uncharacterized protein ChrSV_3148 [Chromobacterium vaccinii]
MRRFPARPPLAALLLALAGCHGQGGAQPAAEVPAKPGPVSRAATIPKGVEVKGKLVAAYSWRDSAGDNLLVLGETYEDRASDETESSRLYAAQYRVDAGRPKRLWALNDGVDQCLFDASAEFDLPAVSFPILGRDGARAVALAYRQTCTSDVSPNEYKLILHAGKGKFGLRGADSYGVRNRDQKTGEVEGLRLPADCSAGAQRDLLRREGGSLFEPPLPGCYQDENDFAKAPPAYLEYMKKQWFKRMRELDQAWLDGQTA